MAPQTLNRAKRGFSLALLLRQTLKAKYFLFIKSKIAKISIKTIYPQLLGRGSSVYRDSSMTEMWRKDQKIRKLCVPEICPAYTHRAWKHSFPRAERYSRTAGLQGARKCRVRKNRTSTHAPSITDNSQEQKQNSGILCSLEKEGLSDPCYSIGKS